MMDCSKSLEEGDFCKDVPKTRDKNVASVCTIYDPKDVTFEHTTKSSSSTYNSSLVSSTPEGNFKRKTFLEKIKKLSFKLGTKNGAKIDPEDSYVRLFYCSMCLLLLLSTILLTAMYIFNLTHHAMITRDIIVDGEFQILRENFDILARNSDSYAQLTANISKELDKIFKRSDVGDYYDYNDVLEITPNMTVKSVILFKNSDNVNVGKIGLAFLRNLRLQHGHTWLGNYTINVQSIGFQIRGEEGAWGEWSEWKGCNSEKDYVATRTRKCLTKDTFEPTDIDRCLLIPGTKGDLDIVPCRNFKNGSDIAQNQTYGDRDTDQKHTIQKIRVVE